MNYDVPIISPEAINRLNEGIINFAQPLDEGVVRYDTAKIADVLQRKEMWEQCGISEAETNTIRQLDKRMGTIVRNLVFKPDHEDSLLQYEEVVLDSEKLTKGDGYLFARQMSLSVKALYHYKKEEWDKAISVTCECIAIIDYLIGQGICTLNLRSYEQNKNISRIYLKSGNERKGYDLLRELLTQMFNGTPQEIFGKLVQRKDVWNQAPILREYYAYSMMNMVAGDFVKFNYRNTDKLMPNGWINDLNLEVNNSDRQSIYNFVFINNQLHRGDVEGFVDNLVYFFKQPLSEYFNILKIYLIIETMKLLFNSKHPKSIPTLSSLKTYLRLHATTHSSLIETLSELYSLPGEIPQELPPLSHSA